MMPDSHRQLVGRIAAFHGVRHCLLTGRGAAAIYAALRAFGVEGKRVVLPAIACPSLANVILYAGAQPLFCDVNLRTFTLDCAMLERLLGDYDDIAAVLPIHLYGNPADMHAIRQLTEPRGIPVIEDVAQALGGEFAGKPLGSFGDVSVLSFGHTKILDVGGGGALLTDDDALARQMQVELDRLPLRPADHAQLGQMYRKAYYELRDLATLDERLHQLYLPMPDIFRPLYLWHDLRDWPGRLAEVWDSLAANVAARRAAAAIYRQCLDHPAIQLPPELPGAVPWRFSFRLDAACRDQVVEAMRHADFDISTWYPSLHRWYTASRHAGAPALPNACRVEAEIVNLWTAPPRTVEEIEKTAAALRESLKHIADRHSANQGD